ncbi:tRNA lysidine(34) synthetase TilS [Mycoplasma sp. Ms02]|uniref:tRNA lysidine(34) synthetase TilS n=1 Tax=Mycoplasma sp. Ms02 TaxID=353851 RepID=UPI001C892528|nr:tRNA lysidine(34) synthetase TilS [Mycoplasma sp. Ms02]QZE12063.1 tRNA lysidine(34) synthetase TilS [Mycoplasma sp. Ms02]
MKVLAVSGGPDSVFLLEKYKNEKVVVCHVNYQKRTTSSLDQTIVEALCRRYSIPLYTLDLSNVNHQGNFQDWARKKRYDFFREIYYKTGAEALLTAHHIDDNIETYLMQKKVKKVINHYGIKKNNVVYGMNIYRPFCYSKTKKQIWKEINKLGLPFAIDVSNFTDSYQRNKERIYAKNFHFLRKLAVLNIIKMRNFFLKIKNWGVDREFKKWSKTSFDQECFSHLKNKDQLVYKYINQNFMDIKLSRGKIAAINDFIVSENRTSKYKLKDNCYLIKYRGRLLKK